MITVSAPEKEAGIDEFHVYPNPTRDLVRLEALEEGSMVLVINTKGQMVTSIRLEAYEDTIDLGGLDAGLYLLRREADSGGRQVGRVLKF